MHSERYESTYLVSFNNKIIKTTLCENTVLLISTSQWKIRFWVGLYAKDIK